MSWSTANDFKSQLQRRWDRGDLLREFVSDESLFPLRLKLKAPSSNELTEQFNAVREWMEKVGAIARIQIDYREVNHRVQGLQRLPHRVWINTLDHALAIVGKSAEAKRFESLVDITNREHPCLLPWLIKRPLQAVQLAEQWPLLLNVVSWVCTHVRPGVYLRQVDIPGVHSKFIESHRAVLAELLDLALPPEAIANDQSGVRQFANRYGFLDKPARIRFRMLDEYIKLLPGPTRADITLDSDSFARLDLTPQRIFITENETNFLAFPPVTNAIVIFGAGYGWDAIVKAEWLARHTIHYWGDIDTHGFAILNQLRSQFEHVTSFLMDRPTLMAHETLWGEETEQVIHDLPRLSRTERALFDELRDNRIRKNLRLEQERIGFGWVQAAVTEVIQKV